MCVALEENFPTKSRQERQGEGERERQGGGERGRDARNQRRAEHGGRRGGREVGLNMSPKERKSHPKASSDDPFQVVFSTRS